MQQWAKFILVLAWKMAMVGADSEEEEDSTVKANCPPGFTCSGIQSCYLIFPTENEGWKYQDPEGNINDVGSEDSAEVTDAPAPLNCYKFIVTGEIRSCNDTQRACENLGGNITVINRIEEYEQLTENVLKILENLKEPGKKQSRIRFTLHVQNLSRNSIRCPNECKEITIKKVDDDDFITNIDYSTTQRSMRRQGGAAPRLWVGQSLHAIVCESTDQVKDDNTEMCSVTTTDAAMQTTPTLTTTSPTTATSPSVHQTSSSTATTDWTIADTMQTTPPLTTTSSTTAASPTTVHQTLTTDETAEQPPIRPIFTENQSEMEAGQSEMEAGGNLWIVAVVASIVVIAIVIILLSFLFIRRRRTKPGYSSGPNQHLPSVDQPIEDGNQDRATVSYSGGGDGVVINEYSTIEDHNQDLGAVVYHILEATDSPAPTSVTNDAYAVPYGDAATKDGVQDQEYDTLNAADMHSRSPQQNELGGGYAVPNKNSKGRKEQDVGEADDTLNAADMHSRSPQQNRLGGHGYAVPNKNSKGRKAKELDVGDAYDTLNATDMQPASKQRRGKPDDAFDDTYNMLNTAEVHSKSGKHNVGSGNEYGKLQNAADVPPKDGMYSYVTTEVGSGIVTMPHGGDQTYDKLQRNTELGSALTADHHYGSLQ